jgi:iron complex transport system substrate-binding protein
MVYALGCGSQLVAVSHECDFPPDARAKPTVVRPALDLATKSPSEIDDAVVQQLRVGASMYAVDETLLRELAPDIILTQNLCQVCAPSGNETTRVVASLASRPEVLYFTPKRLADIWTDLRTLGDATGTRDRAELVIAECERRLADVTQRVSQRSTRPRVFFAEWVDPIYCAGHWVPEMIEIAGGFDPLGRAGADSVRVDWSEVVAARPEVIFVGPCGYSADAAAEQIRFLSSRDGWNHLPAVRANRVFPVDANAFFARPGPRLVDGVEILARALDLTQVSASRADTHSRSRGAFS